jgi:Leucine-rich repeat (LRR) protein
MSTADPQAATVVTAGRTPDPQAATVITATPGAAAPLAIGAVRRVAHYRVVRQIGAGGMGAVFEAVDDRLGRRVALKLIRGNGDDPQSVARFRAEAEACARLRHPGIVAVHDVGQTEDGTNWFAMDLVEGATLGTWARERQRTFRERVAVLAETARAVQHAHDQGLIHRDIKPGNIMVDGAGRPLVMDFGLAKPMGSSQGLTLTGQVVGTPAYMPPEQAQGRIEECSPRSDVWSLGAVLYELLTGRAPFTGETVFAVLGAVTGSDPVPPRRLDPLVPRDLEAVALRCLEKDQRQRYPTALALAEDCERWLAGEPVQASRPSALRRTARWLWRQRATMIPAAALALVLAGIAGYAVDLWARLSTDWRTELEWKPGMPVPSSFVHSPDDRYKPPAAVMADAAGLAPNGHWLWLGPPSAAGTALTIDIDGPESDAIELAVCARDTGTSWLLPAGTSAKISCEPPVLRCVADLRSSPFNLNAARTDAVNLPARRRFRAELRSTAETFELRIDGQVVVRRVITLPPVGDGYLRAGLRVWKPGTRITRIHLARLPPPRLPSPLTGADGLVAAGQGALALEQYRRLADTYAGTDHAKAALLRASALAWSLGPAHFDDATSFVRRHRAVAPDDTEAADALAAAEAIARWRAGDFDGGLGAAERSPGTLAASELLRLERPLLAERFGRRLLDLTARLDGITELDLTNCSLTTIDGLRGRTLTRLDLRGNALTSLEPLRGMPLKRLDMSGSSRIDLEPLIGMPLTQFSCTGIQITSLAPLQGSALTDLRLAFTGVHDLAPIANLRLNFLDLVGEPVADLGPIAGMASLRKLNIAYSRVSDLGPLAGLTGLRDLNITSTPVRDLGPLRGLRLTDLNLSFTTPESLEPLRGMSLMQCNAELTGIDDIAPLRGMPLTFISIRGNRIHDLGPLAGAPLRECHAGDNRITDLTPLRGAPLIRLAVDGNQIADLSALRGAPLEDVTIAGNPATDLEPICGDRALSLVADLRQLPSLPDIRVLERIALVDTDLEATAYLHLLERLIAADRTDVARSLALARAIATGDRPAVDRMAPPSCFLVPLHRPAADIRSLLAAVGLRPAKIADLTSHPGSDDLRSGLLDEMIVNGRIVSMPSLALIRPSQLIPSGFVAMDSHSEAFLENRTFGISHEFLGLHPWVAVSAVGPARP